MLVEKSFDVAAVAGQLRLHWKALHDLRVLCVQCGRLSNREPAFCRVIDAESQLLQALLGTLLKALGSPL